MVGAPPYGGRWHEGRYECIVVLMDGVRMARMNDDTMTRLIRIRNGFVCFRDGNDDTDTSDVVKKLDWI